MMEKIAQRSQFLLILIFWLGVLPANAQVPLQARILYSETSTSGHSWAYEYWFYNDVDPMQSGFDLVGMDLFASSNSTISVSDAAPDWNGSVNAGTISFLSLNVGAPPIGSDIPPSAFLSGFRVLFDYQPGDLAFRALFNNPSDPATPLIFNGVTSQLTPSSVPEPSTIALILAGIISAFGWLTLRRRRKRKQIS